jgi:hypothetical protein
LYFLTIPKRMMRAFVERGAPPSPTGTAVPDYSIYDLATAMATAHQVHSYIRTKFRKRSSHQLICSFSSVLSINSQCCVVRATQGGEAAFVVRDRMRGALPGEDPAKKEFREIGFFPAVTTRHAGLDESEIVAPAVSSSYGSPPLPEHLAS